MNLMQKRVMLVGGTFLTLVLANPPFVSIVAAPHFPIYHFEGYHFVTYSPIDGEWQIDVSRWAVGVLTVIVPFAVLFFLAGSSETNIEQ